MEGIIKKKTSSKIFLWVFAFMSVVSSLTTTRCDNHLFILGLGNVGSKVANFAANTDLFETIIGTSRDPESTSKLLGEDIEVKEPLVEEISAQIDECTHLLISVPVVDGTSELLASVCHRIEAGSKSWVGVISTTGVYGNHDGEEVVEESELRYMSDSSADRHVKNEKRWQTLADEKGFTCHIFRCAGLYGPTRSALHTLWKKGMPSRTVDGVTNRIHEQDVAAAVVAGMIDPAIESGVYNLSDDAPAKRSDVFTFAKSLFDERGLDFPSVESSSPSAMSISKRNRRRRNDSKLVSNAKMKKDLLPRLLFPTYREGLQSIINGEGAPWTK